MVKHAALNVSLYKKEYMPLMYKYYECRDVSTIEPFL